MPLPVPDAQRGGGRVRTYVSSRMSPARATGKQALDVAGHEDDAAGICAVCHICGLSESTLVSSRSPRRPIGDPGRQAVRACHRCKSPRAKFRHCRRDRQVTNDALVRRAAHGCRRQRLGEPVRRGLVILLQIVARRDSRPLSAADVNTATCCSFQTQSGHRCAGRVAGRRRADAAAGTARQSSAPVTRTCGS